MHKFSTDHFFVAYAKLRIANIFWYANSVRTVRSAAVLSSMGCEHGRMPACRSCFRTVNMSMLSSSPACVQMYPDSSYSYRTQCFLLHVRVGAVDWKILRLVHSDMIKVRGALPTLSLMWIFPESLMYLWMLSGQSSLLRRSERTFICINTFQGLRDYQQSLLKITMFHHL